MKKKVALIKYIFLSIEFAVTLKIGINFYISITLLIFQRKFNSFCSRRIRNGLPQVGRKPGVQPEYT